MYVFCWLVVSVDQMYLLSRYICWPYGFTRGDETTQLICVCTERGFRTTLQRSPLFCANIVKKDPGRAKQNSLATAVTNFTKPGAHNILITLNYPVDIPNLKSYNIRNFATSCIRLKCPKRLYTREPFSICSVLAERDVFLADLEL